jgi:histone-lysine N-methyltransferase SETMAR
VFVHLRSAPSPHKDASFCQFLTPKDVTTLYHPPPPYSPDSSPPDYFRLPNLKIKLEGLRFTDVAEIQEAVNDELKKIKKDKFSATFQKLYDHAKACICANGAYFE